MSSSGNTGNLNTPQSRNTQFPAEPQVSLDPAILDISCQDHQVKCKYCDRHFSSVAECNMHVNRRHKKVGCEKHFVKQADCDNHFRDVYKFACSIKRCSAAKYNKLELHEHMRLHHQPEFVFRCNRCVKVFRDQATTTPTQTEKSMAGSS